MAEDDHGGSDQGSRPPASLERVDRVARDIVRLRSRPLLVLYYHEQGGAMVESDVKDVYSAFRQRGWHSEAPRESLDVLVHSLGGEPEPAYRIAQVTRNFAENVDFLVPEYAWSAATLLTLSGNTVRLGSSATLGPIDVTVGPPEDEIELASIEYYKRFVVDCLRSVIQELGRHSENFDTTLETELLRELVTQVTAISIGELYRMSEITLHYANRLLMDYMFAGNPKASVVVPKISEALVKGFPAHDFVLDYHMSHELGLRVEEMPERESDLSKAVVEELENLADRGDACPEVSLHRGDALRAPFIRLYDYGFPRRGKVRVAA
jgi:Serine dehydrogenase proteinase